MVSWEVVCWQVEFWEVVCRQVGYWDVVCSTLLTGVVLGRGLFNFVDRWDIGTWFVQLC